MSKKRNTRNRSSRTQSKVSKILSSFHHETDAKELFLSKLSSKEIKANFSKVAKHIYFRDAVDLSLSGIDTIYRPKTPDTNLEKSLSWCGLPRFH